MKGARWASAGRVNGAWNCAVKHLYMRFYNHRNRVALSQNICLSNVEVSGCYSEGVSDTHPVFAERVDVYCKVVLRRAAK